VKVGEGTDPARSAGENFFWSFPPLFGSTSTISRVGERFRDGQLSLVTFLSFVLILTVPPFRAQSCRRHNVQASLIPKFFAGDTREPR